MKARNYIQQLILLLIPVGLLTACLSEEEGECLPNEGKVPVTVQLGGQYAIMSGKDAPDSNTRATNNSALDGVKVLKAVHCGCSQKAVLLRKHRVML